MHKSCLTTASARFNLANLASQIPLPFNSRKWHCIARMICTKLHHPCCLFVNRVEGTDSKLQFHFPLFPRHSCDLPVREGRVFASRRDSSEALSAFFERLINNFNRYFDSVKQKPGSTIRQLQTTQMKLVSNGDASPVEVKPSLTLEEAFLASDRGLQLRVFCEVCGNGSEPEKHQFHVDVQVAPAWLKSCALDLLPQVGCPILPALDASNFSLEHSQFQWFVSKPATKLTDAKWPLEPTSGGLVFTPKPEHVNCFLRLRVLPHDSMARPGIPFGEADCSLFTKVSPPDLPFFGELVTCKQAVNHAPMQVLHHSRQVLPNFSLSFKAIPPREGRGDCS
uniref:2',5'-phosphodiesterase 12 n=1 Tax=Schistocephalus solidus TaxID=70667 RepID=A0A0V0J932_SCHSO